MDDNERGLRAHKRRVERTLINSQAIHGKGQVVAIVWSQITNLRGVVVREHGKSCRMDACEFQVSRDWKTVRFLSQTRLVL
jgi:hypothetical protein